MQEFDLGRIMTAVSHVAASVKLFQVHRRLVAPNQGMVLDLDSRVQFSACVKILQDAAEQAGFNASVKAAERVWHTCAKTLRSPGPLEEYALARLCDGGLQLLTVFSDEMSHYKGIMLGNKATETYDHPDAVFGEEVNDRFPSTEFDIQEAGKCIALERFTASVFHSMRIMEIGLEALSRSLGLDIASNWNNALNQIEKEVRNRNGHTHGPDWRDRDEAFYSEAVTHFRVVKNAWRNHTMHKRETFDHARANAVFQSTASFMQHLARRLNEDGDFF